jgi:hypothetical protein
MAAPSLTSRSFPGSFSGPLPAPGGSSGTPLPAGGRANPIYKALGTSFDDPGSREALEIASSFYAPVQAQAQAQSPGKEKGKAKADEGDGTDQGVTVDPLVQRRTLRAPLGVTGRTSAAAMARTQLKRDVETKLATGSQKFLEAFGEVDNVSRGGRVATSPCQGTHRPRCSITAIAVFARWRDTETSRLPLQRSSTEADSYRNSTCYAITCVRCRSDATKFKRSSTKPIRAQSIS